MSFRHWISVITLLFIALIVFFSWHEIVRAFQLLEQVNLWILALIIPIQIIVYLAAGEMMFSYLRSKGSTSNISLAQQTVMALEMNFVNHTLPSAGVSGISYMTWRLGQYGITPARAAAAQLVRYVAGFGAFILLLIFALAFMTIDGNVNRWVLLLSGGIVLAMVGGTGMLIYMIGNLKRIEAFAAWSANAINNIAKFVSFGHKKNVVKQRLIIEFFGEMHGEYLTLRRERHILIKPFLWGIVFNVFDVAMFAVTFWALGSVVNPAPILIAYGLASIAGFIVVTPGGAGAYEAIMVSFLATAGISAGVAIAGILLTRIAVLIGTIGLGYVFYQRSIVKYGKSKA